MRKVLVMLAMMSVYLNALTWQNDIDNAIMMAKKSNKDVMIMIESDHCRWCHKMHETTLKDAKVTKALSGYVLVKVNRDNEKLLKLIPSVAGVPTILFVTPNKKILATAIGYNEPFDFLSYISDAKRAKINKKSR